MHELFAIHILLTCLPWQISKVLTIEMQIVYMTEVTRMQLTKDIISFPICRWVFFSLELPARKWILASAAELAKLAVFLQCLEMTFDIVLPGCHCRVQNVWQPKQVEKVELDQERLLPVHLGRQRKKGRVPFANFYFELTDLDVFGTGEALFGIILRWGIEYHTWSTSVGSFARNRIKWSPKTKDRCTPIYL